MTICLLLTSMFVISLFLFNSVSAVEDLEVQFIRTIPNVTSVKIVFKTEGVNNITNCYAILNSSRDRLVETFNRVSQGKRKTGTVNSLYSNWSYSGQIICVDTEENVANSSIFRFNTFQEIKNSDQKSFVNESSEFSFSTGSLERNYTKYGVIGLIVFIGLLFLGISVYLVKKHYSQKNLEVQAF